MSIKVYKAILEGVPTQNRSGVAGTPSITPRKTRIFQKKLVKSVTNLVKAPNLVRMSIKVYKTILDGVSTKNQSGVAGAPSIIPKNMNFQVKLVKKFYKSDKSTKFCENVYQGIEKDPRRGVH